MKLSIHSLNQTLFDGSASRITAKTAVGELTILDNHIPLLVPLVSGLLHIGLKPVGLTQGLKPVGLAQELKSAKGGINAETTFSIRGGFLEVKPKGEVVVLANVTGSK